MLDLAVLFSDNVVRALLTSSSIMLASYVGYLIASRVLRVAWADDLLEIRYIAGMFFFYDLISRISLTDFDMAVAHANLLYGVEVALGINWELPIQTYFLSHAPELLMFLNKFYVFTHLPSIIGFFVWLKMRERLSSDPKTKASFSRHYMIWRTRYLWLNAGALFFYFLFPCAPPRYVISLGIIDTVKHSIGFDPYESLAINPYAAFPSMHFGYSLFICIGIHQIASRFLASLSPAVRWLVRVLLCLYFSCMFISVSATGNHFVLDCVGGVFICVLAINLRVRVPLHAACHTFLPVTTLDCFSRTCAP